jgi:hypothetical protein
VTAELIGLLALAVGGLVMLQIRTTIGTLLKVRGEVSDLQARVAVLEAARERGHDDGK